MTTKIEFAAFPSSFTLFGGRRLSSAGVAVKLDPMKRAILFVVVPLAILVASLWAVPFILPTSQPRPTMTRAERVEAEQTAIAIADEAEKKTKRQREERRRKKQAAVHQAAINRLFGSKPADEPTTTMREELAKGLESDLIKGWAGASDEQILALENEYLAADGRSMQETIDLIREVFDEALLDLTLSDDEIRTSIVNALNHEKDRRGLVGDQPVKRFKTVEAYFSDGNPKP